MEFILFGIMTAFNFGIILSKLQKKQYLNALIDAIIMVVICVLFSGSFAALATGMTASAIFSLYLIWKKPTLASMTGRPTRTATATTSNAHYQDDFDDDF